MWIKIISNFVFRMRGNFVFRFVGNEVERDLCKRLYDVIGIESNYILCFYSF